MKSSAAFDLKKSVNIPRFGFHLLGLYSALETRWIPVKNLVRVFKIKARASTCCSPWVDERNTAIVGLKSELASVTKLQTHAKK
jgi:hypothetical protein